MTYLCYSTNFVVRGLVQKYKNLLSNSYMILQVSQPGMLVVCTFVNTHFMIVFKFDRWASVEYPTTVSNKLENAVICPGIGKDPFDICSVASDTANVIITGQAVFR